MNRKLRLRMDVRIVSRVTAVLLVLLWIGGNLLLCAIGAWKDRSGTPLLIDQAYSLGVQLITRGRFTPGPVIEILVLLSVLAAVRWLFIRIRIFFGAGPVEVRPLDDASGAGDVDTHRLDVTFREYLTLSRLYQVTTIPGDPDSDQIIEILRTPAQAGWRGLLAAAYSYAIPRRAFVVSATLRRRDHHYHKYGVSVQVRKLPGYAIELESQWSSSFERALQRAAYAVGAYILPYTRRCRNVPWSEWRGRTLPVSLFRDYQRAKKMVTERRYDEAMALYRNALLRDANNIGIRYEVGQLYERLGLYPDALYSYLQLVNEIFPPRTRKGRRDPVRVAIPRWWPETARDPFVIRYRYTIALSSGAMIARELCSPDWTQLREWINSPAEHSPDDPALEYRPWRASELADIQRLLSSELDTLFPSCADPDAGPGGTLLAKSGAGRPVPGSRPGDADRAARDVEEYLLICAEREAENLERDYWLLRRVRLRGRFRSWLGGRTVPPLTLTSVRQTPLTIAYRFKRLRSFSDDHHGNWWPDGPEQIRDDLAKVGYDDAVSTSWLEHYNAACVYALVLVDDEEEDEAKRPFAVAAVAALERAQGCGEDTDFVRAKQYWLQAGDPDLVGLRKYECFRAFEARVYGRPLPIAPDVAKYELYLHLRAVLQDAARRLEQEWRKRGRLAGRDISFGEFEDWWGQEEQAWELTVKHGRFYRQWQTRRNSVESLRNWVESISGEAHPVPYPDLIQTEYAPDLDEENAAQTLLDSEEIFNFLGHGCGQLWVNSPDGQDTPLGNARAWAEQARIWSRSGRPSLSVDGRIVAACMSRAAMWAALRHWAYFPGDKNAEAFRTAVKGLTVPPAARRRWRVSMRTMTIRRSAR